MTPRPFLVFLAFLSLFTLFDHSLALVRPSYCDGSVSCQTNINTLTTKGTVGFTKNDEMLAYIKVVGEDKSAAFFPLTDEFSLMEVKKSWTALSALSKPKIVVQVQGVTSDNITVLDGNNFLTQITALVYLEKGTVKSVSWDFGCQGCVGGICLSNFCGFSATSMQCSSTPDNCNLKVFLGFYGTDKDDMPMTSAGKRLSLFRSYGANWAISEAIKLTRTVVPTA